MPNKTIFVTVGTTKFDKLCETVLSSESVELFKDLGYNRMIVQMGNSECSVSNSYEDFYVETFKYKDSIAEDIKGADLVISHAGAGSCLEVLDCNKPLLVVVNTDLMDNHQTEIAEQLQMDGHLYYCTCATFREQLKSMDFSKLKPYPKGNPKPLFEHLDNILGFT